MTQSFGFLALVAVAYVLLGLGVENSPPSSCEGCSALSAGAREWQVWKVVAATGQAAALALLVGGGVKLYQFQRDEKPYDDGVAGKVRGYAIAAAGFVLGVIVLIGQIVSEKRAWATGLEPMDQRLGAVAAIGVACAFPWVALTWLVHRSTGLVRPASDDDVDQGITRLLVVWDAIMACALAFAVFVVIALLPTGALRNLWISQDLADTDDDAKKLAESFPTTDVLLYGAFFALLVAVLVIPMLLSWRAAARRLVDRAYPINKANSADKTQVENRSQLESVLNLDVTLIRNPLAVLSILTPLVTATLAAFLPELGK
ncbi:MAG TPA: hypothetical protein VLI04_16160 [Nocardioidaceae bacterium]|nr:hypothetical protein [Nocardioidaceae bacterium]